MPILQEIPMGFLQADSSGQLRPPEVMEHWFRSK
jgi:hypothetical protein